MTLVVTCQLAAGAEQVKAKERSLKTHMSHEIRLRQKINANTKRPSEEELD